MTTEAMATEKDDNPIVSLSEIGRQIGRSYMTVRNWGARDKLLKLERTSDNRVLGVRLKEINRFLSGSQIKVKVKPPVPQGE